MTQAQLFDDDMVRSASDHALLQMVYGTNAPAGSLLEVFRLAGAGTTQGDRRLLAAAEIVRRASLESMMNRELLSSPATVRDFLVRHYLGREYETFSVLFLDAQNRLIAFEELFRGTLTQTSVHPREVVKRALRHNCGAVLFSHNHPSGLAEPSRADELLTRALKDALALVDVRVLDHIIAAGGATMSFAERGLI